MGPGQAFPAFDKVNEALLQSLLTFQGRGFQGRVRGQFARAKQLRND